MSHPLEQELSVATRAVREAARVCTRVQSGISPETLEKKDRSPVTIADFASQAVICQALQLSFPDDPVIAEEDSTFLRQTQNAEFLRHVQAEVASIDEGARVEDVCDWIDRGRVSEFSTRFWTLDPIDGTKGFLRKEQYAISLSLIIDGEIQLAVLACPNLAARDAWDREHGCILTAVRGAGARVQALSETGEATQPVRVASTRDPRAARICESVESGHSSHGESAQIAELLGVDGPPVRLDSQAKYAVVARGQADVYLRLPTRADYREKIWDHAGGVLIVEEAGGRVSDIHGQPLDWTCGRELRRNQGVVVTNGLLHEAVLSAVNEVLGPQELA